MNYDNSMGTKGNIIAVMKRLAELEKLLDKPKATKPVAKKVIEVKDSD